MFPNTRGVWYDLDTRIEAAGMRGTSKCVKWVGWQARALAGGAIDGSVPHRAFAVVNLSGHRHMTSDARTISAECLSEWHDSITTSPSLSLDSDIFRSPACKKSILCSCPF